MKEHIIHHISFVGTLFVGIIVFSWWILYNPVRDFKINIPGMDNRPKFISSEGAPVNIGAYFARFDGTTSKVEGKWPRFRGADFDNINKENIRLAENWPNSGPPILWSIKLGEGHAGPVISNGRVYLLDYDEQMRADVLRCFSLEDGKEIWRRGYKLFLKRNHGMSRTVPAVTDKFVVTIGPKCHVMCVKADSGDFVWGINLEQKYEAEVPLWYTGQCPLIDGNIVVIGVGGKSLLIGVNLETGEVIWETPNPDKWKMSHSSILPLTFQRKKMYFYCTLGGIVAVSAAEETAGKVLLKSDLWNHNVLVPSPIYLGDGKLFLTAGYGAGSMVLKIKPQGDTFAAEAIQGFKPSEGLASEQQTPVFFKGHLYSILPKDAGPLRNQFVCYHPRDCKKTVWSSGKTHRFGLGPYIVADNKFFILSDDGVLTVIKASTQQFVQLASAKVLQGVDAWGPMALANGRLLTRDSHRLVCIDLRARSGPGG